MMKQALRFGLGRRARVNAPAALLCALASAIALAFVPGVAQAEVAAADPIDASMRTCLARADMSSTVGQVQCMDTARLAWQTSMDQSLQQLLAEVPDAQRKKWDESQKRWKAWREADGKLLAAVLATTQGTSYQIAGAEIQLQPVRDRALTLRTAAASAGRQDPKTRPPEWVLEDVIDGFVSAEAAREVYGVAVRVVDEDAAAYAIDEAETARLRAP